MAHELNVGCICQIAIMGEIIASKKILGCPYIEGEQEVLPLMPLKCWLNRIREMHQLWKSHWIQHGTVCCNPFDDHQSPLKITRRNEKSFRSITAELAENSPVPIQIGAYICNHCRRKLVDEKKRIGVDHADGEEKSSWYGLLFSFYCCHV